MKASRKSLKDAATQLASRPASNDIQVISTLHAVHPMPTLLAKLAALSSPYLQGTMGVGLLSICGTRCVLARPVERQSTARVRLPTLGMQVFCVPHLL